MAGLGAGEAGKGNFWSRCDDLWDRATGGSDVAATPNEKVDSVWPVAQRPAGVSEGCQWIRRAIEDGLMPRFLFLVGGPGAGKSHATAQVTSGLAPLNVKNDGLAHRIYKFQGSRGALTIVNDATIVQDPADPTALSTDITQAVQHRTNLMACINRGILVEESAHVRARPYEHFSPGDVVTLWLHSGLTSKEPASGWEISDEHRTQFLWQGTLCQYGESVAHLMVIYVDTCSLFESRPSTKDQAGGRLLFDTYEISSFDTRHSLPEETIPAADLLSRVLGVLGSSGGTQLEADPVAANICSLGSAKVRSGLLTIARASEIAAATRMTYRELWGFLVRAIVGNAPAEMNRGTLKKWIIDNQPTGKNELERFRQIQVLSQLRFTQAIFGIDGNASMPGASIRNPVLKFLAVVDPVRDAIPGHVGDGDFGWSTPISEAFAGHVTTMSPLVSLLDAYRDEPFADIVAPFDHAVDAAYKELMVWEGLTEKERFSAMSWYGMYLTRLFAVAMGIPAFRAQLAMWVNAWRHAPYLPDGLDKPLRALLRPVRDPEASHSSALIPVFDSRTEAILGRVNPAKIALRFGQIELKTRRHDEGLFLEWSEDGQAMGEVPLDFPLVREAMACSEEHAGVTDFIDATSPRLERIRAARLTSRRLKNAQFGVVFGEKDIQLTVSKGDF